MGVTQKVTCCDRDLNVKLEVTWGCEAIHGKWYSYGPPWDGILITALCLRGPMLGNLMWPPVWKMWRSSKTSHSSSIKGLGMKWYFLCLGLCWISPEIFWFFWITVVTQWLQWFSGLWCHMKLKREHWTFFCWSCCFSVVINDSSLHLRQASTLYYSACREQLD